MIGDQSVGVINLLFGVSDLCSRVREIAIWTGDFNVEPPRAAGCCTSCGMICAMSGLSLGAYLSLSSSGDSFVDSCSQVCQLSVLVSPSQLLSCTTWGKLMRILQPQTESGPRFFFLHFFPFCFSCFFFPVSHHSPIMWNCHFHFHSPIMCKCHSHLFIVFPSCAVSII